MLWVLPEPVSKSAAAGMTLLLAGYLGFDTLWGLIGGWMRLVEAVDRATTFKAAQGTPIRWIVAEEKFAAALRALFRNDRIKIEVVHVPPVQ